MEEPLIVTLKIEDSAQAMFDRLRTQHYPKHANFLPAHCTLFHTLPSINPIIHQTLEANCERSKLILKVSGILLNSNGVAYSIESEELQKLHKTLQKKFKRWLTRKDSTRLKPHITIQNKVTSFKASRLHESLMKSFEPFEITASGFSTWLYEKGPWKHLLDYQFEIKEK